MTGIDELYRPSAPVFWLFNLRQNQSRLERLQEFVWNQGVEGGAGAANHHIPEIQAGFPLGAEPGKNSSSGVRMILHGNAVSALKTLSQRITPIGPKRADERQFTLTLCRQIGRASCRERV